MNAFELKIDPREVEDLAERLAHFDGDALGRALTGVVNDVTARFDVRARRGMNAGVALDDAYVSGRMTMITASDSVNPSASITAQGPRAGLTTLGHYSPKVVYRPAPGAKGDSARGVPSGTRATGVQVEVRRGEPKVIPGAFTMTLRRGDASGDQIGVFVRELGKARHLYAVAPYSLFRHQVEIGIDELADDLAVTAGDAIVTEYGKRFA